MIILAALLIALCILAIVWCGGYLYYLAARHVKINIIEVEE